MVLVSLNGGVTAHVQFHHIFTAYFADRPKIFQTSPMIRHGPGWKDHSYLNLQVSASPWTTQEAQDAQVNSGH